jgi:hypothetical protein
VFLPYLNVVFEEQQSISFGSESMLYRVPIHERDNNLHRFHGVNKMLSPATPKI